MEIVLKDKDGNDILSPTLYQWDQGITIMIRDYFYPITSAQLPYLHFYNTQKNRIYAPDVTRDAAEHTITAEVPNQLLEEPYPITVHVYVSDGGDAINADEVTKAQTVFTATIGVEERMKPDMFEENDNTGEMSSAALRENLRDQISEWKDTMAEAVSYCQERADICDSAASTMHDKYQDELADVQDRFSDALDGCVVRVSSVIPAAGAYGDQTRPVITFVVAEE